MTYENALEILKKYGQEHVLAYYDELNDEEKQSLLSQIEEIDFSIFDVLKEKESDGKEGMITPTEVLTLDTIKDYEFAYKVLGETAIQKGQLALVMLAGGQGTRLGFDGPKGTYNIGLTRDLYIFECQVKTILTVVKTLGRWIHLYIMTSDKNYDATTSFFAEHKYFGYKEQYIHFFKQELVPSVDFDGKILMESPSKIVLSPNGNGGWFSSMKRAGLVEQLDKEGIRYINVFAVDNVLQKIADPVFLGSMMMEDYQSAAKVVKKADPYERVGVLCNLDGKPHIVEYYELTDDMRFEKNANGDYVYNYGVILNYIFPVDRLKVLLNENMPLHAAKKVIPYMNEKKELVKPAEPNGYKFETLALDMLQFMNDCLPFEVVRDYEFAPIKNAEGVDSPETARALLKKNGYKL